MARHPALPSSDQSLPTSAAPPARRAALRAFGWEVGIPGVILALALLLRLWHLSAVTDNYDEGVYWSSLRAMYVGNELFTSVFSSQPPFFLLSLYPLVALFGPSQVAARLGVVCLSLIGVAAMYLLARRLGGPWAGVSAALLLAADYLYLIQSQTIDAEAPAVALMTAALAAATYAKRYPWQAALLSGAATALALLEKLFAVSVIAPILVLFLGYLIAFESHQPAPEQRAAILTRLPWPQHQMRWNAARLAGAYLAGLALAGLLVFLPYLGELETIYQQVIAFHLAADQYFASSLGQNAQMLLDMTTEYPLALVALLGLLLGLMRRRWQMLTAAAWMLAALAILLRQTPLFPRHLVLLSPTLALSAALGLAPTLEAFFTAGIFRGARARAAQHSQPGWWAQQKRRLLSGWAALLLAGALAFNLGNIAAYPLERPAPAMKAPAVNAAFISQVASDLERLTTPQQQVITDDQYIAALANRDVPPELVDTSSVRITTGYLTTAQVTALAAQPQVGAILFYTGRFDKLPGFRAWVAQHFHLARSYGPGQDLYLRVLNT